MSFKIKRPNTPGQRNQVSLDLSHLGVSKEKIKEWGPIIKKLAKGKNSTGGRNNTGRVTVWSRGGGHKRKYRNVLFKRDLLIQTLGERKEKSEVIGLFYDPNRSNYLAFMRLILNTPAKDITEKVKNSIEKAGIISKDKKEFWYYILPSKGLKVGDILPIRYRSTDLLVHGEAIPVQNLPVGTIIYNIVGYGKNHDSQFARAAGSFGQILEISFQRKAVRVRLPSKKTRWLAFGSFVSVGSSANEDHRHINLGKAGRSRWLSRRPHVRGVAMNPVDHPHGGGEGRSSGGRPSVTPWGRPTRNWTAKKKKLNSFIVLFINIIYWYYKKIIIIYESRTTSLRKNSPR